jgi:hypothetical protein
MGFDVKVPVSAGGARASGFSPTVSVVAVAAEPGVYGIQGFPAGLEVTRNPTASAPSQHAVVVVWWMLSPQGAALAAWLSLMYLLLSDR